MRPAENTPLNGFVISSKTSLLKLKLFPTKIKSPSLKFGLSNWPLFLFVNLIFLLSIVPSDLNLINVTGPLITLVPPAISTASDNTLALETVCIPGLFTLPVTITLINLGLSLESIAFVKKAVFGSIDFFNIMTSES